MRPSLVILVCSLTFFLNTYTLTILPGTKWCGKGNISSSPDELGIFDKTDECCRAHDMCPDNIKPRKKKHGLHNKDLYTKSHCDCDKEFYDCLKNANTIISSKTGETYFNILRAECFNQTYPVIGCNQTTLGKCVDYIFDTNDKPIYWQWLDNQIY